MVDHFDRVLVGIAASLAAGALVGALTTLAFHTGVAMGALAATVFVYDAMVRHPPLPSKNPEVAAFAVLWHVLLVALVAWLYGG